MHPVDSEQVQPADFAGFVLRSRSGPEAPACRELEIGWEPDK